MIRQTSNSTVLITGATGAVGPAVAAAFVEAGYHVRTLTRTQPPEGLFAPSVETCSGDVTDAQVVQAVVQACNLVVHLAALLHIPNPPPSLHAEYRRINVEGTQVVVEAAQLAGVQRLVLGSTIAVYGSSYEKQVVTEQCVPRPDTLYGQTKLASEEIVLQAKRMDGAPLGTVLRFASVYGPRVKGNYQRLVQQLARRRFVPVGRGVNYRTLVYDRDVAQAVVLAASHPAAAGQIYNVSDGQTHTMSAIISAICAALGRRPPRWTLPVAPVRLAAGWIEDTCKLMGRTSSIGRATIDKYVEDVQVSSDRIRFELGFRPQVDLNTGWHETIAAMRAAGELV